MSPALTGTDFTETLEAYQLGKINEVIDYARRNTAFYRNHLAFMSGPLKSLSDIAMIPFTKPFRPVAESLRFSGGPPG